MKHRSLAKDPPATGDPLVVDGVKYRIRAIDKGQVTAADRFGPNPDVTRALDDLYWDPLPGVWRVPS